MKRREGRRGERGTTLIEVMVAGLVLLVAMIGFVATAQYAASATAVGHRRTMTTLLRGELMDRLLVLPRSSLATLAGYTGTGAGANQVFVVDACYDVNGRLLQSNASYSSSTYTCGAGTTYRSWVSAQDNLDSSWTVRLYVERIDMGCSPATRFSAVGCSGTDLLLTD